MDIISHTLTGVAVGTVAASFSKKKWTDKLMILLAGGFGGALPDIDAISLWSKFDATFGKVFHLESTGRVIYGEKFWYSHHAVFHSLMMPIVLSLLFIVIICIIKRYSSIAEIKNHLKTQYLKYFAFCLGFIFHLFEDMPTPASVWGGVNFFFPSSNYIGGFGKIWWWNNYDLTLIILVVILFNICFNLIKNSNRTFRIKLTTTTFLMGTLLFLYQVNTRPMSFKYSGHTNKYSEFEYQSKQIQKDILGQKLYHIMEEIDNRIPLYF
ncbi:metal-dependent hydrolase [Flammeovirga sp. MY04]|uniref:metal-dependent hydrolase n=1 Tax=Flammeovirga sp. MY04 TaxID=1191459 RepID=UPI0008062EBA|nr:metal-dependent hydrolase [Flammeovirga sp. MY04]ANQ51741.1 metal-dependent hydrolase [Flammeovirga sp. MY04]